jgi:hypothetical protein
MPLLKRRDDEAEAEKLRQRVRGVQRCCALCGVVAACDPTEVVHRTGLDGNEHLFGRCRDCVALGPDWPRLVSAALLQIDADTLALDGIRPDRFVDRPGARPDQPNQRPWAHVNRQALTKQAEQNAADLDRRTGGPCVVCGATLTPRRTTWTTARHGGGGSQCARCVDWLDGPLGQRFTEAGARVMVATVLLGRSTPHQRDHGPPGIADELGVTLFAASGRTKGTVDPFGWVDVEALTARAVERGIGTSVDPTRWCAVDR